MFLPNKDSFLLTRGPIVELGFLIFLPSTDSFALVRRPIVKNGFTPLLKAAPATEARDPKDYPIPVYYDVNDVNGAATPNGAAPQSADSKQLKVNDQNKRNFLKAAGVVGAGIIVSQLSPKKAHALIMGSSPTTGVVGVKNAANARINPATEETASSLLKTSDLTFDTGSLQVKVTGAGSSSFSDSGGVAKSGLVDIDRHVQVDVLRSALPTTASTETTLQTISFGGFKFTIRLATVGDIDYVGEASIGTATSASSWRIKRIDNTTGVIIQWAGTGVFDQVWDNRASLSYS
jgi:hypothetical protein